MYIPMLTVKAKKYAALIFVMPLLYIFLTEKWYGNSMDNIFIFPPYYHEISKTILDFEILYRLNGVLAGMDIYNFPQFSPSYPFLFFWLPVFGTYFPRQPCFS
jgi:hypothetical protein